MKARVLFLLVATVSSVAVGYSQGRGVSAPEARAAALEKARTALAEKAVPDASDFRSLKDPFNPPETDLKDLIVDASVRPKDNAPKLVSDSDVLQSLLSSVAPTGAVQIGGEPYLLFGEKRLKTGDTYTVTKDGVDYQVVIDSIESSRFSIRYNSQVLFKQIK